MGISKTPNVDYRGKPRKDYTMKTTAIFTRTLITSTVPAFDLVRQGWQIQSIDIDGVITATKQQLVNCDKEAAASNMMLRNLFDSKKKYGIEYVTKIDFGVYKVGLVWNAKDERAETFMNRPTISDISSVIPKEGEDCGFDFYSSDEDLAAAEAWDARTSKEDQDWFINNRY